MTKISILVADDETTVRRVIRALLQEEGFNVIEAADGIECLRLAKEHHPDLILLDILMPHKDGRETCRELRKVSDTPIMMLTALSADAEKVGRFGDGADDYVEKPFSTAVLIARIHALLRRTQRQAESPETTYDDGRLHINLKSHQVSLQGKQVSLSPKEWQLLEHLVRNKNRVVSHEELLRQVWGGAYQSEYRYLKVFVSHLRHKLSDPAQRPRYIHTEREEGYRFETHS